MEPSNGLPGVVALVLTIALIALAVVVAVADLFLVCRYGRSVTVSAVIRQWGISYPLVPFFLGCLMGHLFG